MRYLHQLKKLLKEVWEEFKNTMSRQSGSSTCCSYGSHYPESRLRPEPIRIKDKANNGINKNSTL